MTDWSDIGAVTRLFGNEREKVNETLAARMSAGRNFWKEAADEIERLRGAAQAPSNTTVRDALIEWVRQGYIDADGDHCGSAAYCPDLYKRSVAALAVEAAQEMPRLWACTGCGSQKTMEQIKGERPNAISCCPERKMAPQVPSTHSGSNTPKYTGTYLGYKDSEGREMHCANAFCPHLEKCVKGCAHRVAHSSTNQGREGEK